MTIKDAIDMLDIDPQGIVSKLSTTVTVGLLLRGGFRRFLEKWKFDLKVHCPEATLDFTEAKAFLESDFHILVRNVPAHAAKQLCEQIDHMEDDNG